MTNPTAGWGLAINTNKGRHVGPYTSRYKGAFATREEALAARRKILRAWAKALSKRAKEMEKAAAKLMKDAAADDVSNADRASIDLPCVEGWEDVIGESRDSDPATIAERHYHNEDNHND